MVEIAGNISIPTMKQAKKKQDRKPTPQEIVELPDRIRRVWVELGWPERGAATKTAKVSELSEGQVSAIMGKKRSAGITAAVVVRIADGLKCNPGWLLTGRGEMFGPDAPEITGAIRALLRQELRDVLGKDSESK